MFAGIISNTASEIGYVVLVPLGAAIFYSLGRHPLAGLAAAFAGVSGGYSANLLVGTIDPLLSGITEEAAWIYDANYEVHPAVNWYFMAASTFLITALGTWVTVRIVEPRLGAYDPLQGGPEIEQTSRIDTLSARERYGLRLASCSAGLMLLLLSYFAGPQFTATEQYQLGTTVPQVQGWQAEQRQQARRWTEENLSLPAADREEMVRLRIPVADGPRGRFNDLVLAIPGYGVLRNPETGELLRSPMLRSVVSLIFLFFVVPGFTYGWALGNMQRSCRDRGHVQRDEFHGAVYRAGLFAAQFVAFFNWTNFGSIIAVLGSDLIIALKLDNPLVFAPFILLCAGLNLVLGSASAKWAITAPVFVPMLMRIGYSPEVIQAAYRIGDSATNVITPMMSYFGIIFALGVRYQRGLGLGTLISLMLPYSIIFLVVWIAFFYLWVFGLELPVGPGASTYYQPQPGR